jgi:hypothetical protein
MLCAKDVTAAAAACLLKYGEIDARAGEAKARHCDL